MLSDYGCTLKSRKDKWSSGSPSHFVHPVFYTQAESPYGDWLDITDRKQGELAPADTNANQTVP